MSLDEHRINLQHRFFIVNADNDEIATVKLYRRHGVLFVTDVWVHKDHRRKGLASRLLLEAVQHFGHEPLHLHVYSYTDRPLSDEDLERWYGQFGFRSIPNAPGMMRREADPEAMT